MVLPRVLWSLVARLLSREAGARSSSNLLILSLGLLAAACGGPTQAGSDSEGVAHKEQALCSAPANAIEAENCLPGTPQGVWDVEGGGDTSIQGFATEFSVNVGEAVRFKIDTSASAYRLDIYRMGYYQGHGARLVASVNPSVGLPQAQPPCLTEPSTGLIDCGNWAQSASWSVPPSAVSGIYFARAVRLDNSGASQIFFVVRNDASASPILFQTSDTSWQAYNTWGGNSFYEGAPVGRAYKLSYNRPFQGVQRATWVYFSEYPMVRWLEANGYDVSYFSGIDSDRRGSLIRNHALFLSTGHDEYWSRGQRENVEAARDAGVHLAFFSGNKIFWKTRWENSIDGSNTPYRTLVCYKETHAEAIIDPANPPVSTGTWRDSRYAAPSDGAKPENALAGTLFRINGYFTGALSVPQAEGRNRFWRNTSVATLTAGQTAAFALGTLGGELDVDEDNGFRPAGLFHLSSTPITTTELFLRDAGNSFGAGSTTHNLTLYRHASGALVFSAGTYTWSWGLDSISSDFATDVRMQQATVNLFADMGVQPATLQSGLIAAAASTDVTAPSSTITLPLAGASVPSGSSVTITGTAADAGGGLVSAVEVSTDGGASWHPAAGRESWTYTFTPAAAGTLNLRSRAVDDSGNLQSPGPGITIAVGQPATLSSIALTPANSTIPTGSVQFTATGTYSDGSTQNLTAQVAWASSQPSVATINASGLATAVSQGTTTISAVAPGSGVSGSTTLAVQPQNLGVISATLPGAVRNTAYSASLSAGGGTAPYTWSIASGLPPGLSVNPSSGVISGTPTSSGAFTFSVQVSDAVSNTATRSLAISVSEGSSSIWPNSATPAVLEVGDTGSVNLGVKFRSQLSGNVTGIRFYKGLGNTGTHTGQLWTSTGTLLASATFTSETASGWQQVSFSSPVTISANTVYVASYHAPVGRYSMTRPYFAGSAVSSPPLEAIADNGTGNGVYAYGPAGTFPSSSYQSTNYWVDVVFAAGAAPTLTSLAVTPPAPTIATGVLQFTATGTYSDGSSFDLSNVVSWASSQPNVATIGNTGLAAAVSQGSTTISAALGAVSASTSLAVQPQPLGVSTASLPNAAQGAAYSVTLAANGGTAPYSWLISSGLPPGLALNAGTGAISGVPSVAGNYSFTAEVTDALSQTATRALGIVVSQAVQSIWPASTLPGTQSGDTGSVNLGLKFRSDVAGRVLGVRFYKADGNTGTHTGQLWSSTGSLLASVTFTNETTSGWQQALFATPVTISANTVYVVSYHAPVGRYSIDRPYFATSGVSNPPLHALADDGTGNGLYAYGPAGTFPNASYQSTNYWVDVVFSSGL